MGNFPPYEDESTTVIQSQPNSREAEEAVLGSVLINPDSYFEISQVIKPEDFYIIRNQWIWRAYMRLHDHKVPIDILTVSEDLEEQGQLGEIGGQAYLLALVNQTPTSLHAEAYAHIVEQTAIRRRMLAAANEIFIPLQPHYLALHGLSKLLETVAMVRSRLNHSLAVSGVVL